MRRPAALTGLRSATVEWLEPWRLGAPLARLLAGETQSLEGADACIAGYPRSANTVAYFAFRQANPGARLVHHLHTAGPLVDCAERGIPCAVLIRPPLDAITSLLIFHGGRVRPGRAVVRYVHFYERVARVRDRVAICRFDEVVSDPASVARSLNARFGTGFAADPFDEAAREGLAELIERRQTEQGRAAAAFAIPRPEKEAEKPEVRRKVAEHRRFARAEAAYDALAG